MTKNREEKQKMALRKKSAVASKRYVHNYPIEIKK